MRFLRAGVPCYSFLYCSLESSVFILERTRDAGLCGRPILENSPINSSFVDFVECARSTDRDQHVELYSIKIILRARVRSPGSASLSQS